jgi:hypothetical protein
MRVVMRRSEKTKSRKVQLKNCTSSTTIKGRKMNIFKVHYTSVSSVGGGDGPTDDDEGDMDDRGKTQIISWEGEER